MSSEDRCPQCGGLLAFSFELTVKQGKLHTFSTEPSPFAYPHLCIGHPDLQPTPLDAESFIGITQDVLKELRAFHGYGYTDAFQSPTGVADLTTAIKRAVDHHQQKGCYHDPPCDAEWEEMSE